MTHAHPDFSKPLGTRERQVLQLVAEGLPTDEIGGRLFLARDTVKAHLYHAFRKLGARTRAQAVYLALKSGAIQ